MTRMSLTRRFVAIVAAALQLTLPLAAYARTTFVPGPGDICTVNRAADHGGQNAPAGEHSTHCALCMHGTPPALPMAAALSIPVTRALAERVAYNGFAPAPTVHARANARAPPRVLTEST
jgi:hypothetical protein